MSSQTSRKPRSRVVNTHVASIRPLLPPACLIESLKISSKLSQQIVESRNTAASIVHGDDDRILLVIGPCSLHDTKAAIEYARRLVVVAREVSKEIFIIMRAYFEKPRTTIGWKGLINDPSLDGQNNINVGLHLARSLLIGINEIGLPCGTEFLDTITPQYYADLISWGAIGARTTESQLHRELVSGLSMPVGFKNGTSGNIKVAVDGIVASRFSHAFLGVTRQGLAAIVDTAGNPDCHVILRGGDKGPNYSSNDIAEASSLLDKAKAARAVMIDCSHGNSLKDFSKQKNVCESVCQLIEKGESSVIGFMIESNLVEGNQSLNINERIRHESMGAEDDPDSITFNDEDEEARAHHFNCNCNSNLETTNIKPSKYSNCGSLKYGQSVTDGCIGWDDTVILIQRIAEAVKKRRLLKLASQPQ